jgi:fibronectin type 3 domain-containing protein
MVMLNWGEPALTTDLQSVRSLGITRICRSTEAEMTACGNPAGEVTPSRQRPSSNPAKQMSFTDSLPSATQQQNPAGEVTYAVEVLNRDGRGAGLSNRVRVPAVPALPPPESPAVKLTGDGGVVSWTSAGESTSVPNVQHRYRIYRREQGSEKDVVVGEAPVGEAGPEQFLDSSIEWEKAYIYRITAVSIVSRPGSASEVEGDDSAALPVVVHDVFPPAVPTGVQAASSGEGQKVFIELVWAPVGNADLAGYNVYRRDANGVAMKLNSELVKSPAYRDNAVAAGTTYFYSISAVDLRGNESEHSEEASETVR